jgi:glucan biosynthesis protein C
MLFVVSVVTLPLLLFLKSGQGQRLIDRLAGWSIRPGGMFLFVITLALVQLAFRWLPVTTDRTWADFLWCAVYFVVGYLIAADDRFTDSMRKHSGVYLALWVVVFLGVGGVLTMVLGFDPSPGQGFSLLYVAWQIAWSVVSWSAVAFVFGLGAKHLNFTNGFLGYGNEAGLPFFLFHQTIILIVGWFVLPWEIGNLAKFLLIVVISFLLILLLYEALVRHGAFMRFLFCMAPKKKQAAQEPRPELA